MSIPNDRKAVFSEPNALEAVAQFHSQFDFPIVATPALPSEERSKLRLSLLHEEVQQLEAMISKSDVVQIAEALADIQYVLSGAVLEFGELNRN
jgi:predicted HAD superfamily Cof-like phosphohydrolase